MYLDDHVCIAVKMREIYDKYWGRWENMNMSTFTIVLLDSRNKEILDYILDDIFGEDISEKSNLSRTPQSTCLINVRPNIDNRK